MRSLFAALVLAGCSAACPMVPPYVPPVQPMVEPAPERPSAAETVVAEVGRHLHAAQQRETKVVLSPDATRESIAHIREADRAARQKLSVLERQARHPTNAALQAARDAVQDLDGALQ